MGIKDLRPFLKSKKVNCFYTVPLSYFQKKRIGIDALNWVFCYLGVCIKNIISFRKDILEPITQEEIYEKLVLEFLNFNNKFINHDITPVWVWDGTSKESKDDTKEERREAKKKISDKKDNIYNILKGLNPLERPYELIKEYKNLLPLSCHLKFENIERLKNFSEEIGVPTITAKHEGESLGASLCVKRILAAFWSADTDTYPMGCPLVVKGFEYLNNVLCINCVFTPIILKDLKLSHSEFRDFCIMLGTDFNKRIYGMGPVKSYKLISEHRTIENIEKNTDNECSSLYYKSVRGQLCPYITQYNGIEDLKVNKEIDYENVKNKYLKLDKFTFFLNKLHCLSDPENIKKIK